MRSITARPDLVAQVQQSLIDAIASGELAAGDRVTQEDLAERLGVSRQPVLQALVLLRDQGLVITPPNRRGMMIAPLDAEFICHLYELRSALDGAAAAAAARRAATVDAEKGRDLLRRGREAIAGGNIRQLVKADHAFHRFIYESSGNPLLMDSAARHWPHTQRTMAAHIARAGSLLGVWREHAAILDAILAGNESDAEKLGRHHAAQSLKLILASRPPVDEAGVSPLPSTRAPVRPAGGTGPSPQTHQTPRPGRRRAHPKQEAT